MLTRLLLYHFFHHLKSRFNQTGLHVQYNFVDFDEEHPDPSLFDVSECYPESAKLQFTIRFPGMCCINQSAESTGRPDRKHAGASAFGMQLNTVNAACSELGFIFHKRLLLLFQMTNFALVLMYVCFFWVNRTSFGIHYNYITFSFFCFTFSRLIRRKFLFISPAQKICRNTFFKQKKVLPKGYDFMQNNQLNLSNTALISVYRFI